MMKMKNFFPSGIVTGKAFCNRDNERAQLAQNIKHGEHTVVVAPRRYGKTSLIMQTLKENNFLSVRIDLFFVLQHEDVVRAVTENISELISTMLPKAKSASKKFIDIIMHSHPKFTFNLFGQKLEIGIRQAKEQTLSSLLKLLDEIATTLDKKCVIVFDEFQQVGALKENHAVEASIRHAVELSKNVSYVFCGSKRHLLNEMFSNRARPLYHLCELMKIDRISTPSYKKFLDKQSKSRWSGPLQDQVFQEIILLTENHPYYVSALSRHLWRLENIPVMADVQKVWIEYVAAQSDWIASDVEGLTLNQRKVLNTLASAPTKEPQGQIFCQKANITPASVKRSMDSLLELDMIFQDRNQFYNLLDPAVAYFIRVRTM